MPPTPSSGSSPPPAMPAAAFQKSRSRLPLKEWNDDLRVEVNRILKSFFDFFCPPTNTTKEVQERRDRYVEHDPAAFLRGGLWDTSLLYIYLETLEECIQRGVEETTTMTTNRHPQNTDKDDDDDDDDDQQQHRRDLDDYHRIKKHQSSLSMLKTQYDMDSKRIYFFVDIIIHVATYRIKQGDVDPFEKRRDLMEDIREASRLHRQMRELNAKFHDRMAEERETFREAREELETYLSILQQQVVEGMTTGGVVVAAAGVNNNNNNNNNIKEEIETMLQEQAKREAFTYAQMTNDHASHCKSVRLNAQILFLQRKSRLLCERKARMSKMLPAQQQQNSCCAAGAEKRNKNAKKNDNKSTTGGRGGARAKEQEEDNQEPMRRSPSPVASSSTKLRQGLEAGRNNDGSSSNQHPKDRGNSPTTSSSSAVVAPSTSSSSQEEISAAVVPEKNHSSDAGAAASPKGKMVETVDEEEEETARQQELAVATTTPTKNRSEKRSPLKAKTNQNQRQKNKNTMQPTPDGAAAPAARIEKENASRRSTLGPPRRTIEETEAQLREARAKLQEARALQESRAKLQYVKQMIGAQTKSTRIDDIERNVLIQDLATEVHSLNSTIGLLEEEEGSSPLLQTGNRPANNSLLPDDEFSRNSSSINAGNETQIADKKNVSNESVREVKLDHDDRPSTDCLSPFASAVQSDLEEQERTHDVELSKENRRSSTSCSAMMAPLNSSNPGSLERDKNQSLETIAAAPDATQPVTMTSTIDGKEQAARQEVPTAANTSGTRRESRNTQKSQKSQKKEKEKTQRGAASLQAAYRRQLKGKLSFQQKALLDEQWIEAHLHICGVCTRFVSKRWNGGVTSYCSQCNCQVCFSCDCSSFHLDRQAAYWKSELEESSSTPSLATTGKAKKKKNNKKKKQNNKRLAQSDVLSPSSTPTATSSTTKGAEATTMTAVAEDDLSQVGRGAGRTTSPEPEGSLAGGSCSVSIDLLEVLSETGSIIALANFIQEQEGNGIDLDFGYDPTTEFPPGIVFAPSAISVPMES